MKMWHDDVRPAPEGWTWVRTNEEAQALLNEHEVVECSLDHDLGFHDVDATQDGGAFFLAGSSPDGSGYDLVRWMCENDKVPAQVTIHSWNLHGAQRMANHLRDHGHSPVVTPYQL
jgi:hypothetical protein